MTSRHAGDVTGPRDEGQSASAWSKLVIAGTVGGACAVFTACFVVSILVCRRWIRHRRAIRRRRLKRRQRTMSSNSTTGRSSVTTSTCSGRHTLPAMPGKDLSIPLPPGVHVNRASAMSWWNRPSNHVLLDWSLEHNQRDSRQPGGTSPFIIVDVPSSIRRSTTSTVTALTTPSAHGENVCWSSGADDELSAEHRHELSDRQSSVIDTSSPHAHTLGGEIDRRTINISPLNNASDGSADINFNLSQYIIQRRNEAKQRQRAAQWCTSTSDDSTAMNSNWRRADLVDDTPTRERSTWELTQRSCNFPVRVFPSRLSSGDVWNGQELTVVDSSDEDVWIPRLARQTRVQDRREANSSACERDDGFRTRTKPTPDCLARDHSHTQQYVSNR